MTTFAAGKSVYLADGSQNDQESSMSIEFWKARLYQMVVLGFENL